MSGNSYPSSVKIVIAFVTPNFNRKRSLKRVSTVSVYRAWRCKSFGNIYRILIIKLLGEFSGRISISIASLPRFLFYTCNKC